LKEDEVVEEAFLRIEYNCKKKTLKELKLDHFPKENINSKKFLKVYSRRDFKFV